MVYKYTPEGVCSLEMIFEINDNDIIQHLEVVGGCNGNLKGISKLIEGMNVYEVINKLSGIKCGLKSTSCPDQISKALKNYLNNRKSE